MSLLKKRTLQYSDAYNKKERRYYIIKDNDNSRTRISKISNYSSIDVVVQDRKLTKALVIDNYFDNDYMKKLKKESIKYPVSKELEK